MKLLIINDTHYGFKHGNDRFLRQSEEFFDRIFQYCEEHNIKRILHLGDFFDHRRYINFRVLARTKSEFLDRLRYHGIHMDIVPGNHDVAYKNTNSLNSITEVFYPAYQDCVTINMTPSMVRYDELEIGLIPWITEDNVDLCVSAIQNFPVPILAGHFEISGFQYIANSNTKSSGFDRKDFARFEKVLSGHFHTKSTQDNIHYLGSPYQMNWGDVDDKKYFHVLDTSTRELEPIENKQYLYQKIYYNDYGAEALEDLLTKQTTKENIASKYVRVVVTQKNNYYLFDKFLEHIREMSPYDLKILENFDVTAFEDEMPENAAVIEDTETLMLEHIDAIENDNIQKDELKSFLHELYLEASQL